MDATAAALHPAALPTAQPNRHAHLLHLLLSGCRCGGGGGGLGLGRVRGGGGGGAAVLGGRLGHRLSHLSGCLLRIGGRGGGAVAGGCRCGSGGGCHLHGRRTHGLLGGSGAGIVRGGQQGRGVGRGALGRLCEGSGTGRVADVGRQRWACTGGWRRCSVSCTHCCRLGAGAWEPLRDPRARLCRQLLRWRRREACRVQHPVHRSRSDRCSCRRRCRATQLQAGPRHPPFEPQQPMAWSLRSRCQHRDCQIALGGPGGAECMHPPAAVLCRATPPSSNLHRGCYR